MFARLANDSRRLGVLRGVQTSAAVAQAIKDANAALDITVGTQIAIGTSLTNAPASALVATLAAFNEGKAKPPASRSRWTSKLSSITCDRCCDAMGWMVE
jgi:hypothetical protein